MKAEQPKPARHRKRARLMLVPSETYTLAAIATRDANLCGICDKKVQMNKSAPHPLSPTIDHILPIAVGGSDTLANVQLAHFICNSRKGDRPANDQIRLVG